jgi:hypothetical protein
MSEFILEGSNTELLNLFSKFKEKENYNDLYQKLKILSQFRLRDMIKLGDVEIPDIGPDPEILNFHSTLEGWTDQEKEEIKYCIKVYEGGSIESMDEAIILMQILKGHHPEKKEIMDKIINDIMENKIENLNEYLPILSIESNHPNHILFSSLFVYFATFFSD